jgi:hypothetical protein
MFKIKHQLNHLIPNWEVEHLFIGTFNPIGGDSVSYFYGREKNFSWKVLSEIFNEDFNPKAADFFELLVKHKIACIDIIQSVVRNDNREFSAEQLSDIVGKGYSDSKIINGSIRREYNTVEIQKIIMTNNCKVYSTWGRGSNLKDWINEIQKISFTANLVSPSPVARVPKGESKYNYVLNDWRNKIIL